MQAKYTAKNATGIYGKKTTSTNNNTQELQDTNNNDSDKIKNKATLEISNTILAILWSSVLFTAPLLVLYFIISLAFKDSLTQFGEDNFATLFGGGRIAKTANRAGINSETNIRIAKYIELIILSFFFFIWVGLFMVLLIAAVIGWYAIEHPILFTWKLTVKVFNNIILWIGG